MLREFKKYIGSSSSGTSSLGSSPNRASSQENDRNALGASMDVSGELFFPKFLTSRNLFELQVLQ